MSQRPKHACFYSKKCPHSRSFLEELSKTPYTSEFQFVCVDPGPDRPKLPTWLKAVPTLLIDGEADPLTDEKVFNWLSLRRIQGNSPVSQPVKATYREPERAEVQSRQELSSKNTVYDPNPPRSKPAFPEPVQTRASPNEASKQMAPQSSGEEPNAWHSTEMAGTGKWSDPYSFIEDQFSIEKGVGASRIERNFSMLDGMAFEQGGANKVGIPSEALSEKAKVLNNAMEDFRKKRDADLPAPINRI